MSKSAYIRNISSLEQLRIALAKFCENNRDYLQYLDSKIQTRISNLKSHENYFQRSIEMAEKELRYAKSSLDDCESNTYEDENGNTIHPDCRYEKNEVVKNTKKLQTAKKEYEIFRQELKKVEKSIASYNIQKTKFETIIQFEKENAIGSLFQLIKGAEDYITAPSIFINNNNFSNESENHNGNLSTILDYLLLGYPKITLVSIFSFVGLASGQLLEIFNKANNDIVVSSIPINGSKFVCTELKIKDNKGTILNINIPSTLQNEKIGKALITNLETICRINNCNEIIYFSSSENLDFFKKLNYKIRENSSNINLGIEIYKALENNFDELQKNANNVFNNSKKYFKLKDYQDSQVNPLMVITPANFNNSKFWKQRGNDGNPERYIELLLQFEKSKQLLKQGKSVDDLYLIDPKLHNAYQIFKNQPIKLIKKGNYYQVEQGRHRIMAAQLHFKKTGEIIPITANITEYKI